MDLSANSWHSIRLSAHEGAPVARRSAGPRPWEGAREGIAKAGKLVNKCLAPKLPEELPERNPESMNNLTNQSII